MERNHNAETVLNNVNYMIDNFDSLKRFRWSKGLDMYTVSDDLNIFDWWVDTLSMTRLKRMRSFLNTAIKLGFSGYVCFNVGVDGCSHGMWAHVDDEESDCLFHDFNTTGNDWDMCINGVWLHDKYNGKLDFKLADIKRELKGGR